MWMPKQDLLNSHRINNKRNVTSPPYFLTRKNGNNPNPAPPTNSFLTLNHLNLSHVSKDGRVGSAFATQRAAGAGELFA